MNIVSSRLTRFSKASPAPTSWLILAAFLALSQAGVGQERTGHVRPTASEQGLAIVELTSLPDKVEWSNGTGVGRFAGRVLLLEFRLIRWIDDVDGLLADRIEEAAIYKVYRSETRMGAMGVAQPLQGHTFVAIIALEDGALHIRTLRRLERQADRSRPETDTKRLIANELAGFNEVKALRRLADPAQRARRFRRLAGETDVPSFSLAWEGETMARRESSDENRHEIGLGLLELSLRGDAAHYVQAYSAQLAQSVESLFRENGAAFRAEVVRRLAAALQEVAPEADSHVERANQILWSLYSFVQTPSDCAACPELVDDLILCHQRLSVAQQRANHGIESVNEIFKIFKNASAENAKVNN